MINCKELGDRILSVFLAFSSSRKKADGTIDNPFTTLQDGLDSAGDGRDGKPGKVIYVNNLDGRFTFVEKITDPAILRAWRPMPTGNADEQVFESNRGGRDG